ncbi:MAG: c-type cytochrome [Saprospiraceae bacterium]|nr:c-type cytochrome [Saprospiraceae bacterium]
MKSTLSLLCLLLVFLSCKNEDEPLPTISDEEIKAGGATTVFGTFSTLFEQPAANLNATEDSLHRAGNVAFEGTFVTAPAVVNPGLGPYFNHTSCAACHGKNGRSPFPDTGDDLGGLLLRISIPGAGSHGEPLAVPGYGGQLQQRAIYDTQPEAAVIFDFVETLRELSGGEQVMLRKPVFSLQNPNNGPLPNDLLISPRMAPPVIGLGLLEAIAESDILSFSDENDVDGDGISGKPNYAFDLQKQQIALGRFGWKAAQPSLYQQTAAAFVNDMGVTSPLFPAESCEGQPGCDDTADDPEITASTLLAAAFYSQSLGVPARRNVEAEQVRKGQVLFQKAGCDGCHRPSFTTAQHPEGHAFLSNQTIFPYTDLLLHDMGEGLADHRPDHLADGREWRTPPLWGIGLTPIISGHSDFLHDGRARSLLEAVLWHGGEAEASRQAVEQMSKKDRAALVAFLESL